MAKLQGWNKLDAFYRYRTAFLGRFIFVKIFGLIFLRKFQKTLSNQLESVSFFCYNLLMKTLYDVQQLLKRFGIIVYLGKRLYDIEMMKIELERLYQSGLIEKQDYLTAELILRREHRLEKQRIEEGKTHD